MRSDADKPNGLQPVSAMESLKQDARVEARMLDPTKPVTDEQRSALVEELRAYRERNRVGKQPISWAKIAGYVGVGATVLSELVKGTYKGDVDRVLRMVDQFLAREDQQGKRPNIRDFVRIKITEYIVGAIRQCITRRSIGVITGEPGSGKSKHAEWFLGQHEGAVLITPDDADCDAKFIVDELHKALKIGTYVTHTRQKKREIEDYLRKHLNTVILVDESQMLTNGALEMLRSLHDKSDATGQRNVPVILFGDENFYKVVMKSRGGERTPFSPQITSRMFPVVSLERHALDRDDDGQVIPATAYTVADIDRIVRQQRLKLVRADAIRFAVKLANLHGWGRLRLAARVLEIAIDIRTGAQVTIDDMRASLESFLGPDESRLILEEMREQQKAERLAAAAG